MLSLPFPTFLQPTAVIERDGARCFRDNRGPAASSTGAAAAADRARLLDQRTALGAHLQFREVSLHTHRRKSGSRLGFKGLDAPPSRGKHIY